DGVDRELDRTDLVIADADRPVAIAGIMGGEETEIGEQTTTVLLEAANFDPYTIYLTSERHRLRSEASNRWEKGVDPYAAEAAADLATNLILELAGGELAAAADVHDGLPERPVIAYRPERADLVTGVVTPPADQHALLGRLGFERDDGKVVVPTWRARDVTREIDVVEGIALFEIARVYLEGSELPEERLRVAGICQGGYLRVKGVVEALFAALKAEPAFERAEHPLLHPGKTARTQAGVLGELHPRLLEG